MTIDCHTCHFDHVQKNLYTANQEICNIDKFLKLCKIVLDYYLYITGAIMFLLWSRFMITYVFPIETVTLWVTVKLQDFVKIFNYGGKSKQNITVGRKIVLCT